MTIDERELSQRLAETAAQVSAPVFTTEELSGRIRRRRARFFATAAGTVAAVAAVAVAVPVALRGPAAGPGASTTTGPGGVSQPVVGRAASAGPPPLFVVTVNGRALASAAGFVVSPGERLTIILDVTVPAHQSLSALWVGITNGMLAPRPDGPAGMSPILAADRSPLGPGVHHFTLHWVTPGGMRAGASRQLSAEWLWFHPGEPGAGGEKEIVGLTVPAAAGT